MVGRQPEIDARTPRITLDTRCRLEEVRLDERSPYRQAAAREESVGHGAAHEERVDAAEQVLDDVELAGHLGAAEHRNERPIRARQQRSEVIQLRSHQQTGARVRDMGYHPGGGGVRPVRRTKRVVDIQVR